MLVTEIRSIAVETYANEDSGELRTISSRISFKSHSGENLLLETFLQEDEYGVIKFIGEEIEGAVAMVHKHVCEKVDDHHAYFLLQAQKAIMKGMSSE